MLNNVHQLIERLSSKLQNTIILENYDFELIAYSAPSEFSFDSIQQKTILAKRCPLFVIEHLKKEGIVEKLAKEDKPIRVHLLEDRNFYQRVAISVKHRKQLFGYLWIYEPEEVFTEEQLHFIAKIAARIGQLLHANQRDEEHDVHSLLWKLVNGEFATEIEIHQAAKLTNYSLPQHFSTIILSVKEAAYLYLFEKVKTIFSKLNIIYYLGKGTEIIGLVQTDEQLKQQERIAKFFSELDQVCTEEESKALLIGIGNPYEQIEQVRKSYLEALEVIETMSFLNVPQQQTYFYHRLGLYRHIKKMYKKNVTEQYRNGQIIALMEKDLQANSELVKTVWYYLKNDTK